MNGAQLTIDALVRCGVDVCFANPGTSEMHFVAALDQVPAMRGVLALFEGVATGAADGYGRMAGHPAVTLLHLGPGLGNGIANLHNARRARTPVVALVGDHATYHQRYDAPLQSDIAGLARNVSGWYRESTDVAALGADVAAAVAAASGPPGQVATLVVPADLSWTAAPEPAAAGAPAAGVSGVAGAARTPVPDESVAAAARVLRSGRPAALLLGGAAHGEAALRAAARVAAATGARLLGETFPARAERGGGLPAPERLAYLAELAQAQLAGLEHLILVDARAPVSFFAYPGKPSALVPDGCAVLELAGGGQDAAGALAALAEAVGGAGGAGAPSVPTLAARPEPPTGALDAASFAAAVAALLPEGAIVSDEANTSGIYLGGATAAAPRHDWLTLTGGAIGQGLPVATGAAVACPDRPVLCLQADGSAAYTLQALWTQAREGLNVTTVLLNNRSYAILNMELDRVGATASGPRARSMLDLSGPQLDWVELATGLGVPATRATTADELVKQLQAALAGDGPSLIEAVLPPL